MEIKRNQIQKIDSISSLDCFNILKINKKAKLIDVRTREEWEFVGVPDLSIIKKDIFFISWQYYPSMSINKFFKKEVIKAGLKKDDHLYFLCRSGQRSLEAAKFMFNNDYNYCFNIDDGFEGRNNSKYHRSKINGWKYNQLPWKQ